MKESIIKNDVNNLLTSPIIDWSRFYGKTVLITGANGMLPAYMVFTLLELNKKNYGEPVHVIGLVRNAQKAKDKFGDYLNDSHFDLLVQDVASPILIDQPVDFIIHAASQASPKYYRVDPVGTIKANVVGTINTLELAREKQSEGYLYFSSSEVYGVVTEDQFPVSEQDYGYIDLLKVRSCYCESKRMGDNLCLSYHEQYGVNAKIIRIFHTYGPGLLMDDGRVFGDFCKSIVKGENIILHSTGQAMRPFCYITDAIIAMFKVLLDGQCTAYNMANMDAEISIRHLAEKLVGLYPEKHLSVVVDLQNQGEAAKMKSPLDRLVPDCTKLMSLGWKPSVSVDDGFRNTIAYMAEEVKNS